MCVMFQMSDWQETAGRFKAYLDDRLIKMKNK